MCIRDRCLGVYDRLVVVLENHLLFQGIFYTVLDLSLIHISRYPTG